MGPFLSAEANGLPEAHGTPESMGPGAIVPPLPPLSTALTNGRAESSLCSKCSLENETPNHHVGNCKLYQDIRVKYFRITTITGHDVVPKSNINKLATYVKGAGRLSELDQ